MFTITIIDSRTSTKGQSSKKDPLGYQKEYDFSDQTLDSISEPKMKTKHAPEMIPELFKRNQEPFYRKDNISRRPGSCDHWSNPYMTYNDG